MRARAAVAVAAVLAASSAEAGERLWLRLEARFLCGGLQPLVLEVLEGASTELPIPAGCAFAGRALRVELACPKGRCAGRLWLGDEVMGAVEERRGALVVSTRGAGAASPAAQLALAVLRKDQVTVDEARLGDPVAVTLAEPSRHLEVQLALRPGEPTPLRLDGVSLTLEVRWADATHVRLLASTSRPARWGQLLALGEAAAVPCASLDLPGPCEVTLTVARGR